MQPIIHTKLNPVIEILGLIYVSQNPKFQDKEEIIKQAEELGINGEELYKKTNGILRKYVVAFEKHMVIEEIDGIFFSEVDANFLFFAQILFASTPEWLDNIESIPEQEIINELMYGIRGWVVDELSENATTNEVIDALSQTELSPNVCWQFLRLIQHPKQQLTHLAQIIRKNIPAYEHALLSIEKPLAKRIELFEKQRSKNLLAGEVIEDLLISLGEKSIDTVIPMLISPTVQMNVEGTSYMGLFTDDVFQMIENSKKTYGSNPVLKAIGDSSKFDILTTLNRTPMYNLELAEHLGLSAATVSHHMQILIVQGLVSVEKRDGRVYYTLEKEPIRQLISELQTIFDV